MASLTGNTIQSTYDSLLKVTDNDSITGSLKRITDGLGNNTPLYLSSSAVEIVSTLNVTSTITASNLSGTNTGDETKSSIETKLGAATSSNSGYLTSTDWSTFNNKIAGTGTLNKLAKFSSSSSIADSTITDTGSAVTIGVATSVTGSLTASSLIRTGGTSSQFLKADGSVDSTTYTPTSRTLTINGTTFDLSADRTWTIVAGVSSFNTRTGAITLTSGDVTGALGYTPYNSTNPNNYIALTALSATSPLLYNNTTGAFSIPQATGSINGFLSATDWTTFNNKLSAAIIALNGLTSVSQSLQTGTSGTDFAISSAGSVHTFNIPTASGSARGLLSSSDWTSFNNKVSSQWITSGSNIYYTTGNVGIGTSSLTAKLTIDTVAGFGLDIFRSDVAANYGAIRFRNTANSSTFGSLGFDSGGLRLDGDAGTMYFSTSGSERMRITSGGAVGIGTSNPNTQLHVAGSLTVNDVIYLQRASSSLLLPVMTYWNGSGSPLTGTKGDIVAIGNAGGDGLVFVNSNTERMRINGSGNVGIGTTSPQAKLHSNSDILTGYFQNGTNGIYDALKLTNNTASNTLSGNGARIQFYNNANNGTTLVGSSIRSINVDYGWASDLVLSSVRNNGYSSQSVIDAIWIKNSGNVGIGTSGPVTKLNVAGGYIRVEGTDSDLYYYEGTRAGTATTYRVYDNSTNIFFDGYRSISLRANQMGGSGGSINLLGGNVAIGTNGSTFAYIGGSTTYNTSRLSIEVGTDQSGITTNVNSSDTRYHLYFRNTLSTVGSISTNTYATSFNTSSDYRLKEDLKPFNGLSIIKDIKVYDFKWKGVEDRNYGVVAHEIAEVIPYAVNGEKDGEMHQSVDYSKLVPILIQSIQELKAELDELKNK